MGKQRIFLMELDPNYVGQIPKCLTVFAKDSAIRNIKPASRAER